MASSTSSSHIPRGDVPAHAVSGNCKDILSGYRHADFPDLSSRRFAPDAPCSITRPLPQNENTDPSVLYSIIVAALGRVLGAYCGCQDVLLGLAIDEEERVLPVRISWEDAQTWKGSASAVSDALADPSWPRVHPDILRRALDLAPKQSPASALVSAGSPLHPSLSQHFPVSVVVGREDLTVTASERVFHHTQSELFLAQVVALVKYAVIEAKGSLSSLPELPSNIISSFEKQEDAKISETYCFVPPTRLATDHVALRVAENPHAIAVRWYPDLSTDTPISSFPSETITYGELEKKSNQLGRWLLRLGLQRNRSVAVCMKRDIWFHVTLLGILKSGGCYVPVSPSPWYTLTHPHH